jgi:cyclic beta-1,2-glucan synthetase
MHRARLSGKVGAGLDPCGAIQVTCDLGDGQEREIVFRLGVGRNAYEASKLMRRFRGVLAARSALEAVEQHWQRTLGAVQVETPDPSVNVLANGWLVYQTLACRVWARSGYYQSGGAFGFRDQLQDVMALDARRARAGPGASPAVREPSVSGGRCPALVASAVGPRRAHALFRRLSLAAPGGMPLRQEQRRHRGVLDEPVHFLEGRPVNPEDDSYYDLPGQLG